ncbi:MFS transporter [Candidatus Binatus sp.]|uniref:MFS transporter n=1 Tax=Candidatus Binatus sp. TaxID=2811406 RepID=UPI003CC5CCD0
MSDPAPTTTTPPTPEDLAADSATRERATVAALLAMLFYQGFAAAIISVASPWIGKSFHLDGAGIARLFAWISLSAFGALALSRMIDRYGRRRMILWCVAAIPVCSIGAAIATSLLWFAIFQIALYAMVGAAGSGCVVMLSEELPIARRARGQSFGGLAAAVGAGLCVFLMPIFDAFGWSWRWMFVISAAGIAILPAMARLLPESERWELSDASGINTRTRFYDVFQPLYRKRSITMILCALAGNISTTAANAFGYYHAVSVVGMSSAATSTMTIVAGGLGLLGFPLGAWTSERFGRVPTIVSFGIAITAGHLWYFWGPPPHFAWPFWWLASGFFWFNVCDNAGTVGANAAATELFPTPLRGTMIGWFALVGAIGSVISNAAVALLANKMGGMSIVVGALSIVGIPAAIAFGLLIDETRGMSLEMSAKEDQFTSEN